MQTEATGLFELFYWKKKKKDQSAVIQGVQVEVTAGRTSGD